MIPVSPKKSLGQHFLADKNIAEKITGSLSGSGYNEVIEIGPGMGMLTQFLLENNNFTTSVVEIDRESAEYLRNRFPEISDKIHEVDFLNYPVNKNHSPPVAIIGNFPYNISSRILFSILENRAFVSEVVCMLQKEVAERIASPPGTKIYGILSVLIQAFYKTEYLFSVGPQVFVPPPRVKSAVLRLSRKPVFCLDCNEQLFFRIVKTAFNQRRKMLRNSLSVFLNGKKRSKDYLPGTYENFRDKMNQEKTERKKINPEKTNTEQIDRQKTFQGNEKAEGLFSKRPEQLTFGDFVCLTNYISPLLNNNGYYNDTPDNTVHDKTTS